MSKAPVEGPRAHLLARSSGGPVPTQKPPLGFALLAIAAFGLYLASAVVLANRGATLHFGADAHLYAPLAQGTVYDRVARFHPLTVALAVVWMSVLKPLAGWISPQLLLKGLFAAVGAFGTWAAAMCFSMFMARRHAMLWGAIYASSLSVWYFSSIEESKIVTATLAATYIAIYLRLQQGWSMRVAALLTAILFLGCLNEIVSGFLVIIPAMDTLLRRGWNIREGRWIAGHATAGLAALLILELVVNGWWMPRGQDSESASHMTMLLHYLAMNDFSLSTLYAFVLNWLFFAIAAPTPHPLLRVAGAPYFGSYFEPALNSYFSGPVPASTALAFLAITLVGLLLRADRSYLPKPFLIALVSYSLLRGAFFFAFNPKEVMLFTGAVSPAHLLLLAVPFAASRYPAKTVLLLIMGILLFLNNGAFMIGG